MYNIIFQTFITPDKPSHTDILYRLDISERHYYRLRQQAVNILSIRLWTAPVGCLDAWLELLTLLEGVMSYSAAEKWQKNWQGRCG